MSIKRTLLAVTAIAAFALAALPALASANPKLDFSGSKHFTVAGGAASLETAGSAIDCTSSTGTGEFENSQTGTIEFTFHGCKDRGTGLTCRTVSPKKLANGTITTTTLPFHLATVLDEGVNKPAVLITPSEPNEVGTGHFASFKCAFDLVPIVVKGTGIIGTLTAPAYNTASNTFTVNFAVVEGKQQFTTVVGDENEYDLEASVNGGAYETATQSGSGTGTFTEGAEGTLTEG